MKNNMKDLRFKSRRWSLRVTVEMSQAITTHLCRTSLNKKTQTIMKANHNKSQFQNRNTIYDKNQKKKNKLMKR